MGDLLIEQHEPLLKWNHTSIPVETLGLFLRGPYGEAAQLGEDP